jgi:LacI family transcriptional regulator
MKSAPQTTAVFCGNDVLGAGALRSARELGVKVPEDVSIIGFDDIELAEIAYPALTTVHVPHREMGRRAGEALAKLVTAGTQIEAVELEASLVFRDTLAPVRR